jgi:hypothetical protein
MVTNCLWIEFSIFKIFSFSDYLLTKSRRSRRERTLYSSTDCWFKDDDDWFFSLIPLRDMQLLLIRWGVLIQKYKIATSALDVVRWKQSYYYYHDVILIEITTFTILLPTLLVDLFYFMHKCLDFSLKVVIILMAMTFCILCSFAFVV